MDSLPADLPVTLNLGDESDRPFVWIDCVYRGTSQRIARLSPRAPLSPRLTQRLADGEAGYMAFEDRVGSVAWKGIAKASGRDIDFLVLDPGVTDSGPRGQAPRTEELLRLMYISQAAPGLGEADFNAILAAANRRNVAKSVTGALCLRDGYFGQILEGPESAVRDTYALIERDPRHTDPVTLLEERAHHRLYGGWSMKGIHGENEITASDELTARLTLAGRRDSVEFTRRWLQLLSADSGPAWRTEWLSGKQSVLVLRELIEQAAPRA